MKHTYKAFTDMQESMQEMFQMGMTMYYKTWVQPFFKAWCKDTT
jgi:hypothetical protein